MWIFKAVSVENELAHRSHGKIFGAVLRIMAGDWCEIDVDIEDGCVEATGCVDSVWYFKPCFETKVAVHRSHWKGFPSTCIAEDNWGGVTAVEAEGGYSLGASISREDSSFLFRKSCLLLALRRRVEGLDFFLTTWAGTAIPLDSMEKMKLEPTVREKEKVPPWLASVWQKARHCCAKEESPSATSSIADILDRYLN